MAGGFKYIVPAGDCTTKFQKVYLAKKKSEFASMFMDFVNWMECQSEKRVKQCTMDNELRTNKEVIESYKLIRIDI